MAKWPTDKELEEIYRKGSEQHDFKYDPMAWDQLNIMLNKKKRKTILLLFFIGIFLLSSAIITLFNAEYFKINNSELTEQSDPVRSANDFNIKIENNDLQSSIESTTNNNEVITKKPKSKSHESEHLELNFKQLANRTNFKNGQINSKSDLIKHSGYDDQKNNQMGLPQPDKTINKIGFSPVEFTRTDEDISEYSNETDLSTGTNKNQEKNNFLKLEIRNQSTHSLTNDLLLPRLTIKALENSKSVTIPDLVQSQLLNSDISSSAFAFSALIGLESSWTPNGEYSKIDLSFGLGGTYFLNQKFGISLGLIYISDSYTAMAADYSPPKGYWENRGAPSWTQATCNMIESSYGISYHFNGRNKRGFGVDLNLLSNFMMVEDYYYHYQDGSKNFVSKWNMDNSTFLSSISIATDYNLPLSNQLFIRMGPFIKLPLEGIGHGKVMLSSFGLRMKVSFISR